MGTVGVKAACFAREMINISAPRGQNISCSSCCLTALHSRVAHPAIRSYILWVWACMIEGTRGPQELLLRWQWGEMRALAVCMHVCGSFLISNLCASLYLSLTWLFFLQSYFHVSFQSTHKHSDSQTHIQTWPHTELVPIVLLSALPGVYTVWVRWDWRDRKIFCLSCTLLFQALTCQFHLYLFVSDVWQSATVFFLRCIFPASLRYCDASPTFSQHPQFICEAFQTGFAKCQETKTCATT